MKFAILRSLGLIDKSTIFFIRSRVEIFCVDIIAHLSIAGHKNSFIEVVVFLFFTTSSPFFKTCLYLLRGLLRNSPI